MMILWTFFFSPFSSHFLLTTIHFSTSQMLHKVLLIKFKKYCLKQSVKTNHSHTQIEWLCPSWFNIRCSYSSMRNMMIWYCIFCLSFSLWLDCKWICMIAFFITFEVSVHPTKFAAYERCFYAHTFYIVQQIFKFCLNPWTPCADLESETSRLNDKFLRHWFLLTRSNFHSTPFAAHKMNL